MFQTKSLKKKIDDLQNENMELKESYDIAVQEKEKLEKALAKSESQLQDERWELNQLEHSNQSYIQMFKKLKEVFTDQIKQTIEKEIASFNPEDSDSEELLKMKLEKASGLCENIQVKDRTYLKACEEILFPGTPIYRLFPEEDNLGIFEDMLPWTEISWREKAKFGEIINSQFVGCYEFCDYKIDEESPQFLRYRINLYQKAAELECQNPLEILCNASEFFFKRWIA